MTEELNNAEQVEKVLNGVVDVGEGLVFGGVRDDCLPVVIGIDLGTSCSGVGFALKVAPGSVYCGAPTSTSSTEFKVATALLETGGDDWLFGNDAVAAYAELLRTNADPGAPVAGRLFRRFKMNLSGQEGGFGQIMAVSACRREHRLMDLMVRTLQFLARFALEKAGDAYGRGLEAQEVQWVLTVPAIWNDFGKAFMRRAAFKAKLITEESSDALTFALEPEGAALSIQVGRKNNLLEAKSRFVVLDCGGGTIDITAHEVVSESPLHLKAIAAPSGGPWGGELVGDQFHSFLREFLGPALYPVDTPLMATSFYEIGMEFQSQLMQFDPGSEKDDKVQLKINLVNVLDFKSQLTELAPKWNESNPSRPVAIAPTLRNGFLTLSRDLLLSFFEPSLEPTIARVQSLLEEVPGIHHIVVVGGFGTSKVVRHHILAEFKGRANVILPDSSPNPQGAIVHGAVYFGLYKDIMRSRISPYTYGIDVVHNGIDNAFCVLVRRGDELTADFCRKIRAAPPSADVTAVVWKVFRTHERFPQTVEGAHCLGQVTVLCPLNADQSKRKQTAAFIFGGTEIRVMIESEVDGSVVAVHGEIEMQ
jgi:hypothetical protein